MTRTSQGARRRPLGLRARVVVVFSLAGLVLSLGLALLVYTLTRNELLDQRDQVAVQQAFVNARLVRDTARVEALPPGDLVNQVRTEGGGFALLHVDDADRWFAGPFGPDPVVVPNDDLLPADLKTEVLAGANGRQRFALDGEPYLAVGVDVRELGAHYFEVFPLDSLDRTLRILLTSLAVGVGLTTTAAAALGWSVSRRLLRPLSRVADAASDLASGGLDTRLEPEPDPDLDRLVTSFNDMADAVQSRIERETRFASDVSHELRSPITALSAAVEVLASRRDELSSRNQQALDVVVNQVGRFDQMVLDLLEMSRIDAGVDSLHTEPVVLADTVPRIAARVDLVDVPIEASGRTLEPLMLDKHRLERIVVNLLDNATRHGGGPVRIGLHDGANGTVQLEVDDAGPGIPPDERQRVFDRFYRGSEARRRQGTGLGLALVAEHARALGGDVSVHEAPAGGARFVITLPAVEP